MKENAHHKAIRDWATTSNLVSPGITHEPVNNNEHKKAAQLVNYKTYMASDIPNRLQNTSTKCSASPHATTATNPLDEKSFATLLISASLLLQ